MRTAPAVVRVSARATQLFEQEKYWDAIQLLEPAVDAAQGRTRLRGQLTLARCYVKNPRWAREAEGVLLAATREDPQAVDAWALLAESYAEKGLRTRSNTEPLIRLNVESRGNGSLMREKTAELLSLVGGEPG